MHFVNTKPKEKRSSLLSNLKSGKLLRFPGAYNALVAKLIIDIGFDGIYVSGGVMSNVQNKFHNVPCYQQLWMQTQGFMIVKKLLRYLKI